MILENTEKTCVFFQQSFSKFEGTPCICKPFFKPENTKSTLRDEDVYYK